MGSLHAKKECRASRRQDVTRLLLIVGYRFLCAIMQQTAFAPDEFWQGPEISHRMVFGYGHVTWEWIAGIRSYLHPLIYTILYKVLWWCSMDGSRWLMVKGPQMIHATLTAWADVYMYKTTRVYFGDEGIARMACLCQLLNWFGSYCLVRTYSSSIEACLTIFALYEYTVSVLQSPYDPSSVAASPACRRSKRLAEKQKPVTWEDGNGARFTGHTVRWVSSAALCIVIRPASSIFWACAGLYAVARCRCRRMLLIVIGLVVGLGVLGGASILDRWMYGRWELVPWNFFKFNVMDHGSRMYGVNPWHANFTTHLPSMLLSYVPMFLLGCVTCVKQRQWHFLAAACLYCSVYSIPAHKEIRFLLPALLMCIPMTALGLKQFLSRHARTRAQSRATYACVFGLQLLAFLYFSEFHQRGQIDVMNTIYEIHKQMSRPTKVLFLTPCHATPYYSSLHEHIHMRFFDCSPRDYRKRVFEVNGEDMNWIQIPGYDMYRYSEREYFESNPTAVLSSILSKANQTDMVPGIIVLFASTHRQVQSVLHTHYTYHLYRRHSNCIITFEDSTECQIDVLVHDDIWKESNPHKLTTQRH